MTNFHATADDYARAFDADVREMYEEGYSIPAIVRILCTTEEEVLIALGKR